MTTAALVVLTYVVCRLVEVSLLGLWRNWSVARAEEGEGGVW